MLLAVVALTAAHGRGARAKSVAAGSHAVAWRVALGTEAIGFFEPAVGGLREVGHPSSAVALLTGRVALKVPLTAHERYRRSGGKRRTPPSPRRVRLCSRRTPSPLCKRGCASARGRSSEPLRCRHDPQWMEV